MPIRINLKELFPADSQEITVDKLNFNFNKLLELGIGDQGLRGFSGIQGAAGPEGIEGPEGIRGSLWFVGSGTPTLTDDPVDPYDLLIGDLYLDATLLAVWRWDGTNWVFIFDLTAIINNYLSASPSPFRRGLGIGTPKDDRFITFNKRDDSSTDLSLGGISPNTSTNDILFLNNFDEDTLEATLAPFAYGPALTPALLQTDTMDYFNSLLSVYVDHTVLPIGRHHLEFGVLYDDAGDPKLTNVLENFKIRLIRESSSVHLGMDHYSKAVFSLDIPDAAGVLNRNFNSVFEFNSPKYSSADSINQRSNFYVGSRYGFDEIYGTSGEVLADGALFYSSNLGNVSNIGLNIEYTIPSYPSETGYVTNGSTKTYLWLDNIDNVDAIYANHTLYQDGGNIVQIGTTAPREKYQEIPYYTPTEDHIFAGIAIEGNTIYTVNGATTLGSDLSDEYGYFNRYTIENPNRPVSDFANGYKTNGIVTYNPVMPPTDCDSNYQLYYDKPVSGAQVADVAVSGGMLFTVHNQTPLVSVNSSTATTDYYRTYFQVISADTPVYNSGIGQYLEKIGRIGYNDVKPGSVSYTLDDPEELYCAWRLLINGDTAIVGTNGLHQPLSGWDNFAGQDVSYAGASGYYFGGITAIDLADPTSPRIVERCALPFDPAGYSTATTVNELHAAVMDMDIVSNRVYTLTWRQGLDPGSGTGTLPWSIYVDVFDLSSLSDPSVERDIPPNRIVWMGRGDTAIDSDSIAYGGAPTPYKTKHGAITANEKYVYAGYVDSIQVFSATPDSTSLAFYENPACVSSCSCQLNYPQLVTYTISTVGSDAVIYDMKNVGNSLYVLYEDDGIGRGPARRAYLRKYDISGGLTGTPSFTEVWTKTMPELAQKFVISGKHIYVSTISPDGTDQATTGGLVAIDFDGIYTSGAHIESLRADEANVTSDLIVGGDLNVNNNANFGGDARVDGNLAVTGNLQAKLTHIQATSVPYITNPTSPQYDSLWQPGTYKQIVRSNISSSTRIVFNTNPTTRDQEYDTLSEFQKANIANPPTPAGHSIFTVKNNGFYQIALNCEWYLDLDTYFNIPPLSYLEWQGRWFKTFARINPADPAISTYDIDIAGYEWGTLSIGVSPSANEIRMTRERVNGTISQYLREGDTVEFRILYVGQVTVTPLITHSPDIIVSPELYIDRII